MESIRDIIKRSKFHILNEAERQAKLKQLLKNSKIRTFIEQQNLDEAFLLKNLAVLQEFVVENEAYEKTGSAKAVPGFKPALNLVNGDLSVSYVKTAAQKQDEMLKAAKLKTEFIDIPKAIRTASFSKLKVTQDNSAAIIKVKDFSQILLQTPRNFAKGLYLWGEFGVGKTYLMGALVNYLADHGIQSTMVNTATLIADLKNHFQEGNYVQNKIFELQKVPFLVLDDIGTESVSDWARDDVIAVILQYRMQEELPTCFTSNLSLEQLGQHYQETKTTIDEIKAGRLMERIYFLANAEKITGENWRR